MTRRSDPRREGVVVGGRHRTLSAPRRTWRGRLALVTAGALVVPFVAACSQQSGTPTLTWYINPDNGGQKRLAEKCAPANGPYKVVIQILPNSASDQREQLVRRLAAQDSSIDVMSLDPPFVAEFANAGFLKPFDKQDDAALTARRPRRPAEDRVLGRQARRRPVLGQHAAALVPQGGRDRGRGRPHGADLHVGPDDRRRRSARARRSPSRRTGTRATWSGSTRWSPRPAARSSTNVQAGKNATPAIDSPAGNAAAEVVGSLARSAAAPPAMSTATEEEARSVFQGDRGMFMVNWPYVYGAATKEASAAEPSASPSSTTSAGRATRLRSRASPASRRSAASTWPSGRSRSTPTRRWTWSSASTSLREQHPVHGRLREPRRAGRGVRRSPGAGGCSPWPT